MKVLFNALPLQRGTDPQTVILAYAEALRGVSLEGIRAGISKFLRGECENVNPRYVPTPPELARIVRTTVVPSRISEERRIAPFRHASDGERARMRLKMPMFNHAWATGQMDALDRANRQGFRSMVALATEWGITIPPELLEMNDSQVEADWHRARARAWADIERYPPPFMRHRRSRHDEAA